MEVLTTPRMTFPSGRWRPCMGSTWQAGFVEPWLGVVQSQPGLPHIAPGVPLEGKRPLNARYFGLESLQPKLRSYFTDHRFKNLRENLIAFLRLQDLRFQSADC